MAKFYNTLMVIVTVNCRKLLQHTLSNCDGEFLVNFYKTLIVISTVDCGEFNQGIGSEKIGR